MESNEYKKKIELLWKSFSYELHHRKRFFVRHELLDVIDSLCENSQITLCKGKILYRSRIINPGVDTVGFLKNALNKNFEIEENFYGFDSKNSFVPSENSAKLGRCNPDGIVYLYTSEEIITSIMEVRPLLDDIISVSKIILEADKRIINFTRLQNAGITSSFHTVASHFLAYKFSIPTSCSASDYLETQCISEYIKNKGFQGIKFHSSLNKRGNNIVLFDYNDCKPICSFPYKIDEIAFTARCTFPMGNFDTHDLIVTNK